MMTAAAVLTLAGCSISDIVNDKYPPNITPPGSLKTEDGAISLYHAAIYDFRQGFGGVCSNSVGCFLGVSAAFTDEVATGAYDTGANPSALGGDALTTIGARDMPEDRGQRPSTIESWYRALNLARNEANTAIAYLRDYAPNQSKDLIGNMYIVRGLSMTFLADMFCSGIPLSETYVETGFVYKPGSTTAQVYTAAVAQFDTAIANTPDSATFRYMAQVGKARALLNLGKFVEAADAVRDVPTSGWKYIALYSNTASGNHSNVNYTNKFGTSTAAGEETNFGTIGNNEGINGLPFVSANDPRVPVVASPYKSTTYPATTYYLPKWMVPASPYGGTSTRTLGGESITIGNGIEARLIEAEVKAQANDPSFLTILNTLRTTCVTAGACASPAPAGTGGVANLPPLSDPGTLQGRLKMVLDERGYWLMLTGHRQGDLRRYVRVYKWPQEQVYPTGAYPLGDLRRYGTYTNLPIPFSERAINAEYKGCFNRDA